MDFLWVYHVRASFHFCKFKQKCESDIILDPGGGLSPFKVSVPLLLPDTLQMDKDSHLLASVLRPLRKGVVGFTLWFLSTGFF